MSEVIFKPFTIEESSTSVALEGAGFSPEEERKPEASKEDQKENTPTDSPLNGGKGSVADSLNKILGVEEDSSAPEQETEKPEEIGEDPLSLIAEPAQTQNQKAEVDYKQLTSFLTEEGILPELDNADEIEFTPETFKEIWKQYAENTVSQRLEDFGETANQFIDYLGKGGSVEEFASNFNQQLDIESITLDSVENQKQIIRKYNEALGKPTNLIEKAINRLEDSGEQDLLEEAENCKELLLKEVKSQREALIKEQEDFRKEQQLRAETFERKIKQTIFSDEQLSEKEKKEIEKFAFERKYTDQSGNKLSEYQKTFFDIQKDPVKLSKLIRVIKDFDSFDKKENVKKEVLSKSFKFLKEGTPSFSSKDFIEPTKQKVERTIPRFRIN